MTMMTQGRATEWLRRAGLAVIILSGSAALAILLLPVALVLLLALFDTVAHALLVLLGQFLALLPQFAPVGGAGLSPYQSIMDDPLHTTWDSLIRALPCLAGLMLIRLTRQALKWWAIVLLWSLAAQLNGELIALVLLPGIVAAGLRAVPMMTARRQ